MKSNFIRALLTAFFLLWVPLYGLAGYYDQGKRAYYRRDYEKARTFLLKTVEQQKTFGNAYYFLGEVEKNTRNYKKAIQYYQLALKNGVSGKLVRITYLNVIILSEQTGDYEELVKVSKTMWNRLRDNSAKKKVDSVINKLMWTRNEEAIAHYKTGLEHRKSEKLDEAAVYFRKALAEDGGFLAAQFELGLIHYNRGELSEALPRFQNIIAKIPFYGEVHLLLGDIYFKRGAYRDAAYHTGKALELGFLDNPTLYISNFKIASCYYNLRDYGRSREYLDAARKHNAGAPEPLLLRSAIEIKEGDYSGAMATLKQAEEIAPNNTEILYQLGSIYYKNDDLRYAAAFDRLFELTTAGADEVPQKYYKAFMLAARHHYEKENYAGTNRILKELPHEYRDSALTIMYAHSQFHAGNLRKAEELLEGETLTQKEDRFLLALVYSRRGNDEKARPIIAALIENDESLKIRALREPGLKKIIEALEEERRITEEENRLREQERIRLEKERENTTGTGPAEGIEDDPSGMAPDNKTTEQPNEKIEHPAP